MILPDTSIWIDNIRSRNGHLLALAETRQLVMHPLIIGELAMGSLPGREDMLRDLHRMLRVRIATHREVLELVEARRLWGLGFGYVDACLLAATLLTEGCLVWTRDSRLHRAADALGLAYDPRSS